MSRGIAAAASGFIHNFCGKTVEKTPSFASNIHACLNIARIAQEFVSPAIRAFSMS
jgi:hypothetical protein